MAENEERVRIKFTEDFKEQPATIKVVGVGGAGGNAINRMIEAGVRGVEFIVANTDAQDLRRNLAPMKIQMGDKITKGLGVGGNPAKGKEAAEESREVLKECMTGADMIFITAGMGGGTGTGAAPVVAELAGGQGALTVGVVTRPFGFEGRVRALQAENGIKDIRHFVDTLIVIQNERLFSVIDEKTTTPEAFRLVDDVLREAVQSITDVITTAGEINVDFADVRSIMTQAGEALMGVGEAAGPGRALAAAQSAIESPMLENAIIDGAKGVLVNITGNRNVTLHEIKECMTYIHQAASPDAHVFYGQAFDDSLDDRLKVTVIATGFPARGPEDASQPMMVHRRLNMERRKPDVPPALRTPASSGVPGGAISEEELRRPAYLRAKRRLLKP